jgi:hypothetical protein
MTTPATFNTPAGWIERYTRFDDDAEHQIRVIILNAHRLHVTCLCGGLLTPISTIEEALAAYTSYHEEQV